MDERNTFIKTSDGKTYDLDYSLKQLQKMVDLDKFFRVNLNYLVNINCIGEIISYSTSSLKLKLEGKTNEGIIVTRDKVEEYKRWVDK